MIVSTKCIVPPWIDDRCDAPRQPLPVTPDKPLLLKSVRMDKPRVVPTPDGDRDTPVIMAGRS